MKAAVVHDFGQPLQIEEMPVKRPAEHQIPVKVMASGVCHTEPNNNSISQTHWILQNLK